MSEVHLYPAPDLPAVGCAKDAGVVTPSQPRWSNNAALPEGVSSHRIKLSFGVVTGYYSPDVSSHFPRWRVVVVFAIS